MESNGSLPARIYALDALRGIMMLLGIVVHAGLTYGKSDYQAIWPLKDQNNSMVFDVIVTYIHTFRMPVFFVVAGYFAALLFYKKGPDKMLLNRFKRILLPFLAAVLIVYPLVVMSFNFSAAAFALVKAPFDYAWNVLVTGEFLPFEPVHLWFLYFLAMYSVAGWLLAKMFQKPTAFTETFKKTFIYIIQHAWLRLFCMAAFVSGCLYWMDTTFIPTNTYWKIDLSTFVIYLIFFETGWMIYQTNTLTKLTGYPVLQLTVATLLCLFLIFMPWPKAAWVMPAQILIASVCTSLFTFGFIALFLKYFNHYSKRMSYLMDASYWVYIIHLPIVSFIPGLMAGFSISAYVKFAITLLATAIICLTSYEYLVKNTLAGVFLNGKAHRKKNNM